MIIEHFNSVQFLEEYWQKKPCLIKQFSPNFSDPIDENDLAGLAQEAEVDSRIVSNANGKWKVVNGPFDDFDEVCKGSWSLLVQGVDRYIAEVSELSQLVSFVPNWRFDDVMVSFSMPEAGVGAHIDEYDVFILQGKGSRRWQVGLPIMQQQQEVLNSHPLLKLVEDFTPVIDEVLQTGDAIYIPPGHPHKGVTISECLNYSLGFRAPTNLELLHGILDEGETIEQVQKRYGDMSLASIRTLTNSAMLSSNELQALKQNIQALLNTEEAENAIVQIVSRQSLPNFEPEEPFTYGEVFSALEQGKPIVMSPGIKPIFSEKQTLAFNFFIDGNLFSAEIAIRDALEALIMASNATDVFKDFKQKSLNTDERKKSWVNVLTQLVNAGYWELIDD